MRNASNTFCDLQRIEQDQNRRANLIRRSQQRDHSCDEGKIEIPQTPSNHDTNNTANDIFSQRREFKRIRTKSKAILDDTRKRVHAMEKINAQATEMRKDVVNAEEVMANFNHAKEILSEALNSKYTQQKWETSWNNPKDIDTDIMVKESTMGHATKNDYVEIDDPNQVQFNELHTHMRDYYSAGLKTLMDINLLSSSNRERAALSASLSKLFYWGKGLISDISLISASGPVGEKTHGSNFKAFFKNLFSLNSSRVYYLPFFRSQDSANRKQELALLIKEEAQNHAEKFENKSLVKR